MNKKLISIIMIGLLLLTGLTGILVVGTGSDNNPPETPSKPKGPDFGEILTFYKFSTNTTDPDDDEVKYGWDFNGSGSVNIWTDFYQSGRTAYCDWQWVKSGIYNISVKAEDEHGAQSNFSNATTILINTPPIQPNAPLGSTIGYQNLKYTCYVTGYDPDGDKIWFKMRWGDSSSNWMGPFNSSEGIDATHTWTSKGNYEVKVKIKDIHNSITDWSEPLCVNVEDLLDIRIPIINIGKVNTYVKNRGIVDLKNVSWNISVKRSRLIRNIDLSQNGTIGELQSGEKIKLSTESRIVRKFGLVEIEVNVSIQEIVGKPYKRTIKVYGFILGRIIIVPPIYLFY